MCFAERCVRLRLSDVNQIQEADLQLPAVHSVDQLKNYFRKLQTYCDRSVWMTFRSVKNENRLTSVFALQPIDLASGRYYLHLFPSRSAFDAAVIDQIVYQAMIELDVFRLEIDCAQTDSQINGLLRRSGWKEEGLLKSAHFNQEQGQHEDRHLMALLRPEQTLVSIAIVPFRTAVLAITSDENAIMAADFARYGQPAQSRHVQEMLVWFNLTDSSGHLSDRETILSQTGPEGFFAVDGAPWVLKEAAGQAKAYFEGDRSIFDLPLQIDSGSLFQQSVWRALQTIPYGTTQTYESIASAISDGEAAAKKRARAVGAACSANPLPVFIPCHRVIGKDGKLVGFSGGLDIKEYLLTHEIMGMA